MRVKSVPAQIKAAGAQDGTDDGVFEAIVATYDEDSWGDKIAPGAFADTLADWAAKGDPIPVLWSHMSHDPDYHIGEVLEIEERDEGLWVLGRLDLDEAKSSKVYKLLKGRRVTQFSFAYDVIEGRWIDQTIDGKYAGFYELAALKLYEVGPCLIGVNQQTELLDVKHDLGTVRIELPGAVGNHAEQIQRAVTAVLAGKSIDSPLDSGPDQAKNTGRDTAGNTAGNTAAVNLVRDITRLADELTKSLGIDPAGDNRHEPALRSTSDIAAADGSTDGTTTDDGNATSASSTTDAASPDGARQRGESARHGTADARLRIDLAQLAAEVDDL
jgi:HK97 family phage prohead protease